jgi:ubiquinone/menaquinone biosynthesis C-methylase UbiE
VSLRGRLFAAGYDRFTAGAEEACFAAHRRGLLAGASGRVLEIGAGTGANLQHYGGGVTELTAVEPEEPMARRLERRAQENGRRVEVVRAPAEALPFEDASFDVAVSTLVLCTVDDQARALAEVRRVLRPGGSLLFMEHVRADEPGLARWQDRLNGINRFLIGGCNCNRRTLEAIQAAGFSITTLTRDLIPKAPAFVRPLAVGTAEAAAGWRTQRGAS